MNGRLWLAVLVVGLPLVVYPIVTIAGGAPSFPTRHECVRPAVQGRPAAVVFGRVDSPTSAEELQKRVEAVGFTGTDLFADGCGRWEVLVDDVPSVEVASQVQEEARKVGLDPTLELATEG